MNKFEAIRQIQCQEPRNPERYTSGRQERAIALIASFMKGDMAGLTQGGRVQGGGRPTDYNNLDLRLYGISLA